MRVSLKLLTALMAGILALFSAARLRPSPPPQVQSDCCRLVQQALKTSRTIKPGTTRREVERIFKVDGGAHMIGDTRYVYPACPYVKVDVRFKVAAGEHSLNESPDDTVIETSKPYLDLPTTD